MPDVRIGQEEIVGAVGVRGALLERPDLAHPAAGQWRAGDDPCSESVRELASPVCGSIIDEHHLEPARIVLPEEGGHRRRQDRPPVARRDDYAYGWPLPRSGRRPEVGWRLGQLAAAGVQEDSEAERQREPGRGGEDAEDHEPGSRSAAAQLGRMFWFTWKKLSGSYFALVCASRS